MTIDRYAYKVFQVVAAFIFLLLNQSLNCSATHRTFCNRMYVSV